MFHYKLNLEHPNFLWTGSKICKKKNLISPQWLRNIKTKIYPLWRLDITFSKKKYNNIEIINDGGWHFTNIKTADKIHHKMKNFLHHYEYQSSIVLIHLLYLIELGISPDYLYNDIYIFRKVKYEIMIQRNLYKF